MKKNVDLMVVKSVDGGEFLAFCPAYESTAGAIAMVDGRPCMVIDCCMAVDSHIADMVSAVKCSAIYTAYWTEEESEEEEK